MKKNSELKPSQTSPTQDYNLSKNIPKSSRVDKLIAMELMKKELVEKVNKSPAMKNAKIKETVCRELEGVLEEAEMYLTQPGPEEIIMKSYQRNLKGSKYDSYPKNEGKKTIS